MIAILSTDKNVIAKTNGSKESNKCYQDYLFKVKYY